MQSEHSLKKLLKLTHANSMLLTNMLQLNTPDDPRNQQLHRILDTVCGNEGRIYQCLLRLQQKAGNSP